MALVRLRPWLRSWSTYTVLGLIGYVVASIAIGILARVTGVDATGRLVAVVLPAIGFLLAVFANRLILGVEQTVFYQASAAAWLAACGVAWCASLPVARISDLVVVLVAIFNAFGRVGCLHVACCHGRPARIGIKYGHEHVALGFPRRWLGRRIFPIQLVESAASGALAIAATVVILSDEPPGTATCVFVVCYALVRFLVELARGDAARPYFKGASEAQWIAVFTTAIVLAFRPTVATVGASALLFVMLGTVLVANRIGRGLDRPNHLDEIEHSAIRLVSREDSRPMWTSVGLKLSAHALPDGNVDLVCSHAQLTGERMERVATALFAHPRIIAGHSSGLFHVVIERNQLPS